MQHGMDVQLPKESIAPIPIKDIPTITVKSNKKIFWNTGRTSQPDGFDPEGQTVYWGG